MATITDEQASNPHCSTCGRGTDDMPDQFPDWWCVENDGQYVIYCSDHGPAAVNQGYELRKTE